MREIWFRGKRTDNGEWVYGDVRHDYDGVPDCISDYCGSNPVVPETVGQYTGLTDKNGEKIFEGDIVKGEFFGFPMPLEDYVFGIGWQEDVAGYRANYFGNVEIIGNIHDNPELLSGGNNGTE